METWHLWVIAAIFLFIVEIFTTGFLSACLGLGCLASGVIAYFDHSTDSFNRQLLAFSIGTIIGFFGVRPFLLKIVHRDPVQTNVDALVGQVGRVVLTIDNAKNEGRLVIEGDDWRAEAETEEIIPAGSRARIVKVNSTILIVKPVN